MISYEINHSALFLRGKESNSVLLDQKFALLFAGGYCEEACEGGRTCRIGLCLCPNEKTGDTCEIIGMYLCSDRSSFAYVF